MIAKFRYRSENSAIVKIENFAMIEIFAMIAKCRYHSEISGFQAQRKFRYDCEIFAIIAKSSLSLLKFCYACEIANLLLLLLASSSLHYASSSLLFFHPRLDEIDENSYELGIN